MSILRRGISLPDGHDNGASNHMDNSLQGERLNAVRAERKMLWKEFADVLGIRADTMSRIKRGASPLSADLALEIEYRYGYRALWLLGRDNGPKRVGEEGESHKVAAVLREALADICPTEAAITILAQSDEDVARIEESGKFHAIPYTTKLARLTEGRPTVEDIEGYAVFDSSVVDEPAAFVAVRMPDDSMEPEVAAGATVLVDCRESDADLLWGEIALAQTAEGVLLRRVLTAPDGYFALADNKGGGPVYVKPKQNGRIIGRVVRTCNPT